MWDETNKPKAWQEIVGNAGAIQQCKDWIRDFQNGAPDIPRVLIISGPEGCGKSLTADLILRKQGYKCYSFGVKEIKKHKSDKNSLENFCNLYLTNLSELGASGSRRQMHGIILEDYDGLTKSDKTFNKTIVDLVKKTPSPLIPLIVTTSEPNLAKQSTGLLRLALVVTFQRLLVKDLIRIAIRIAQNEQLYLDNDQAEVFAKNAHGDARQLILAMEMFYVGKKNQTRVTLQQIQEYSDSSYMESDEKVCNAVEGGLSTTQSDDERILGMAIGDRGDKRTQQERLAAIRMVLDNSQHFAPFLFQAYTKCLGNRMDRPHTIIRALDVASQITEDMSMGDIIREATWNFEGHYELAATIMLEGPIKRIRTARSDVDDPKAFAVDIKGYQSYYGTDNTYLNQLKIIALLKELNPALQNFSIGELGMLKLIYAQTLESSDDMTATKAIYPVHPDFYETLSRLKAGRIEEYNFTKARQKRLIKCYDELQIINAPRVKFIEVPKKQRKRVDDNDPFGVNWD